MLSAWLKSADILQDPEQTNYFFIQQCVNETYFTARKTVVMQRFARLQTNLGNGYQQYIAGYLLRTDDG